MQFTAPMIGFLLSLCAALWAATIQALPVQAAGIDASMQTTANALVRSAVIQAGHTPIDSSAQLSLRTTLLRLDQSWVVVAEKLDGGSVVSTTQLKAGSADELDIAITRAVTAVLGNTSATRNEEVGAITSPEMESIQRRRETQRYSTASVGPGFFHGMTGSDLAYDIRLGALWEVGPHAAITAGTHEAFQLTELGILWTGTLGGRWYASAGRVSPFLGGGLGLGTTIDSDGFRFGFALNGEAGIVVFRTSSVQMEFGAYYDIVFDGLDKGHPAGILGGQVGVNW